MTIETRIEGAVDTLKKYMDERVAQETYVTGGELHDFAIAAINGIATFDDEEALALLAENPSILKEPLLLPDGDHYAKKSLQGQLRYRVVSSARSVVLPYVAKLLKGQFGDDFDARDALLEAADAVHAEFRRIEDGKRVKMSTHDDRSGEYPVRKALFDQEPEAFIEVADWLAAYVWRERSDLVRKRYVAALEAWHVVQDDEARAMAA